MKAELNFSPTFVSLESRETQAIVKQLATFVLVDPHLTILPWVPPPGVPYGFLREVHFLLVRILKGLALPSRDSESDE